MRKTLVFAQRKNLKSNLESIFTDMMKNLSFSGKSSKREKFDIRKLGLFYCFRLG